MIRILLWFVIYLCLCPAAQTAAGSGGGSRARLLSAGTEVYAGLGHSDILSALAWSPDGKTLATGSEDHTVILWDTATWRPRATPAEHGTGVLMLAWQRDGKTLTSSDWYDAMLWDTSSGRRRAFLPGVIHVSGLSELAGGRMGMEWSPDGRTLAASGDHSVALWRPGSSRQPIALGGLTWTGGNVLAWGPDGRVLAVSDERAIILWDSATGQRRGSLDVGDYATSIAWSPDGKTLASYTPYKGVALWDIATGKARGGEIAGWEPGYLLAWSPDGKFLATLAGEKSDDWITLWDAATGKRLRGLRLSAGTFPDSPRQLVWSPGGRRLAASCDSETILWDSRAGRHLATIGWTGGPLAWSPDGKRFVIASTRPAETAVVCDGRTGRRLAILKRHLIPTTLAHPAWLPDGRTIVASAGEGVTTGAALWDARTGQLRVRMSDPAAESDPIHDLATSPDGRFVGGVTGFLGTTDAGPFSGNAVIWDTTSGALLRQLNGASAQLAWSADGRTLAAPAHWAVTLWDTGTWEPRGTLPGPVSWFGWSPAEPIVAIATAPAANSPQAGDWTATLWDAVTRNSRGVLRGPRGYFFSMAWSPNGRLAALATDDRTVIVSDVASGLVRSILPLTAAPREGYVRPPVLAWQPAGDLLAAGSSTHTSVRVWNAASGQLTAVLPGPTSGVTALAWSPDGSTLAIGGEDGSAALWSMPSGRRRATLVGHTSVVQSLAWNPDGTVLATASADGSLRLWRAATGRELLAFYAIDGGKEWLALTPDGYFTASRHGADFLSLAIGGRVRPLGALRQRLERPDLVRKTLSAR